MPQCEVRGALRHAVPGGYFSRAELSVVDVACAAPAVHSAPLRGLERGNHRDGAELRTFPLCEAHLHSLQELDRRLRTAGWGSAFHGPVAPA